jgi:hypothetical protein
LTADIHQRNLGSRRLGKGLIRKEETGMASLDELLKLDGVVAAGEFAAGRPTLTAAG